MVSLCTAYDFDKLSGGIKVRQAVEGEPLTLLDGREVELRADTLVIADHEKPLALAGIMGGLDSSVTDDTKNIFLNLLTLSQKRSWVSRVLMGFIQMLHIVLSVVFHQTCKSERLQRATQLIVEICGGDVAAVNDVVSNPELLDRECNYLKGVGYCSSLRYSVDAARVTDILQRLVVQ